MEAWIQKRHVFHKRKGSNCVEQKEAANTHRVCGLFLRIDVKLSGAAASKNPTDGGPDNKFCLTADKSV